MDCCGGFAKLILYVINAAGLLAGLALLIVGIIFKVDGSLLDFIEVFKDLTVDPILYETALWLMIAIGAVLTLVSFCGFCGTCKESLCLIQLYIFFVIVLLLAEIVGVILAAVFRSEFDETVETKMAEQVYRKYNGSESDPLSKAWNAMQKELKCCGSKGYTDYYKSAYTNETTHTVPPSCCVSSDVVDECREDAKTTNVTSDALFTQGCYDAIWKWVDANTIVVIAVGACIVAVQIFAVMLACCIKGRLEEYKQP